MARKRSTRRRHSRRRHTRRARLNPVRRRRSRSKVRTRTRTRTVVKTRTVSRRRRRSGGRRRSSLRNRFRNAAISFKSIADKKTLAIAGGAVTSSIVTGFVLTRWGGSLPFNNSPYGRIVYQVGIPVGVAILLRKKTPNFAMGLLIGGVASAIQSGLIMSGAMNMLQGAPATASTGAYLNAGGLNGVSALPPGYSAVDAFGDSPYSSDNAFGSTF